MSDLSDYFSQQDKINQLQCEIKKLKTKLNTENKAHNRYKASSESISMVTPNKSSKVNMLLELVVTGRIDLSVSEISELCSVTEKTVRERRSRIRKEMKL